MSFWFPQIQAESVIWQPEPEMPETKGPVAQEGISAMMLASIWAYATAMRPAKRKFDERMAVILCFALVLQESRVCSKRNFRFVEGQKEA